MSKPAHTKQISRHGSQAARQAWRRFHVWTLMLIGGLTVVNVAFVSRPLPAAAKPTKARAVEMRGPASSLETHAETKLALTNLGLSEITITCEPAQTIRIPNDTRQLRAHIAPCPSPIRTVRNATNGFDATLFDHTQNGVSSGVSTDYLALVPGENMIQIDRAAFTQRIVIERQ